MPIFEYSCNSCQAEFEELVFGHRKVECPKCRSEDIRKKLSRFGMSGVEKPFSGESSGCTSCSKGSCTSCH